MSLLRKSAGSGARTADLNWSSELNQAPPRTTRVVQSPPLTHADPSRGALE
jgi:hypothetical protein